MRIIMERDTDGSKNVTFKAETQQEERDLQQALLESMHPVGEFYTLPGITEIADALERRGYSVVTKAGQR